MPDTLKEFDVHFLYSGFMCIVAKTEEEARKIGNEICHMQANRIFNELHLSVVDTDEDSYVTDVLEV